MIKQLRLLIAELLLELSFKIIPNDTIEKIMFADFMQIYAKRVIHRGFK